MDTKYYQEHGLLRIFISYFKPHRRLFAIDMFCALFVAAVDLTFPLVSRYAMNELLPGKLFGAFFAVMGILLAAYIVRSVTLYIVTVWGHALGVRIEADMRE